MPTMFRFDDHELVEAIKLLAEMVLRLADMTPVAESSGELLEAGAKANIAQGKGMDGSTLAPLSPATLDIYRKQGRSNTAVLGSLGASLRHETSSLSSVIVSDHGAAGALLSGTSKGKVFGRGQTTIPAREFISANIPEEQGEKIENDALDYVLRGWDNT